ncbi:S24 family peptidase [Sphingomonas faeni]|uniref:S24 family peptidase n=1 Tax=Sphingomonas faeni TaxID=185950 RepID=UPI0033480541
MTHVYVTFTAVVNVNIPHAMRHFMRHECSMRKNVPDVLKERLSAKIAEKNMSAREVSIAALNKPDAIRAILAGHMPGLDRLDAIADILDTTSDWLLGRDQGIERTIPADGHTTLEALRRLPKTLPIYGTALGADLEFDGCNGIVVTVEQTEVHMSAPLDFMTRPIGVTGRPDLYVVSVSGHSMEPRFDAGSRVLVDPKRSPGVGDDVVVQLRGPTFDGEEIRHVLIKQLVRRRPTAVILRQFNPAAEFEVPNEQVSSVHRVMPWDEAMGY